MTQAQLQPNPTLEQPARPASTVALDVVADQPMLAPTVQLCGEMAESGFTDTQWLLQRDGEFLQLTELLYRIAEQANGQRTLAEIAAAVSQAIGRRVSADNVRFLIAAKLIPKGLVVKADGSLDLPVRVAVRSPLQVNLRYRVLGAPQVEPIARRLQVVFAPPILLALLLLLVGAHAWVYLNHSLTAALHAALKTPALLLLLAPLSIASAVCHEFGHAAALRYGGGRARGIGVGFYLSFPIFYTDTTDSYRLGRWARVRTDLGGIYLNLLVVLGVIGLSLVTGSPVLVLFVLLLDLQILEQFAPYARFDGYWMLADLTGIPDFFSQMGPFLRTVLPLPWWHGPRLATLKGWVKAVFGIYIVVTVPLLISLLGLMVTHLPTTLVAIWQALFQQIAAFSAAWAAGKGLGMVQASANIVPLVLSTVGILVVLANVGYQLGRLLWRWSKPTPLRRMMGVVLVSTALIALGGSWFGIPTLWRLATAQRWVRWVVVMLVGMSAGALAFQLLTAYRGLFVAPQGDAGHRRVRWQPILACTSPLIIGGTVTVVGLWQWAPAPWRIDSVVDLAKYLLAVLICMDSGAIILACLTLVRLRSARAIES